MQPETLGHYRILRSLGAGGMGQVYLAEDPTLNRKVAVKVLLDDVAADPERRERFKREARAVAALSHPNIVTIYSVEEDAGRLFLTMEYVDGKALGELIPRDGLALDKLVSIAIPLADAVASAHQAGIVHRDLKPSNVMLTADGRVKVLDFGLAHLREEIAVQGATMTAALSTGEGRILGTAAYMSPEQAEGRTVDPRSDLFSLGIVLFEMATGERPFTGDTNMSIISAILKETPRPISSIRPDVPRELARIIRRALQKDPEQRYQTAKDLRNDLQLLKAESDSGELTSSFPIGARQRRRRPAGLLAAAAAVVLSAAGAVWWFLAEGTARPVPPSEWTPITDYADSATQPALSPDGRMITFVRGSGTFTTPGDVYVKLLPNGTPVQLTHDSLGKMDPRFSPDGTEIAYTTVDSKFTWNTYVVPVFGGREPRLLLPNASGLSWIGDHQYLFSEITSGIHMAVVTAGESRADQRNVYDPPTQGGMAHRSQLSPDGQHVLITEEMDINHTMPCRVVPVDGRDRGVTVGLPNAQCFSGAWMPDGRSVILSLNAGSGTHLWRQRFPNGKPEQLTFGSSEEAGVTIAPDGKSLVTSAGIGHYTVWIHDANGDRLAVSEGSPNSLQFSHEGTRLFFIDVNHALRSNGIAIPEGPLRAYDIQHRRTDTMLGGLAISGYDVSPDGKWLAYTRNIDGAPRLWLVPLDGGRPPRQVVADAVQSPSLQPDGFLYFAKSDERGPTPWRVPLDGGAPVRAGDFSGMIMAVSPDGNWRVEWHLRTNSSQFGVYLRHLTDDTNFELGCGLCTAYWPDDDHFAIVIVAESMGGSTYVFPASAKNPLPDGIDRMTDLDRFAAERGARALPHSDTLAPNSETYAYRQYVSQRNLYRVPLR